MPFAIYTSSNGTLNNKTEHVEGITVLIIVADGNIEELQKRI